MTVEVREIDGARSMEIVQVDGVVYLDDGRFCFRFDRKILLRAMERELGVLIYDLRHDEIMLGAGPPA